MTASSRSPRQPLVHCTLVLLLCLSLPAQAAPPPLVRAGVIVLAEQRFDPGVQRLLAERALEALPLYDGRLFYIVPAHSDAAAQAAQIQYLEYLLRRETTADEPEAR